MSNSVRSSHRGSREMIAKLVQAGYLRPSQRNDADAISNAIAQMKQNLRGSVDKPSSGDSPKARRRQERV